MYTVQVEGFILGTYRSLGETIRLTEAQAKTFLREGRIEPHEAVTKAAGKTAGKAAAKAG
ncbi:MAG: hypothetical protein QM699_07715 [Amaricoccus sp.]|uniref:hypothetical protein n=1 Tax=Amaricoccus sp. TaxID=1872485 RepID=UPI0039E4DB1E